MLVFTIAKVRLAIGALMLVATSTLASAESCRDIFDRGEYENALPSCLAEARHFETGYIYGRLDDCGNMIKYYKLSGYNGAIGNLGLNLLRGESGCTKDEVQGVAYLKQSVSDGSKGHAEFLGNYYRKKNPGEARKYYRLSAENTSTGKWDQDRARESYIQLMFLLSPEQKKSFYLEHIKLSSSQSVWGKELGQKAVTGLVNMLDTDELIELFMGVQISNVQNRCELGRQIASQNFSNLVSMLVREGKKDAFANRLCRGNREYFIGQTFEDGFGNKEDFSEAYRLYLIAGANGNSLAKAARERIRDRLTPDQIQEAVCLADFGVEPTYFNRMRCKF